MSQLELAEASIFNERRALYSQTSLNFYEEATPNFTKAIQLDPYYADYPLGRYRQGRPPRINVMSISRAPELRYSTIDPEQVIRR